MIGRRPAWHAGAACRDTPDFLDQNLVVQLAHCAGCEETADRPEWGSVKLPGDAVMS